MTPAIRLPIIQHTVREVAVEILPSGLLNTRNAALYTGFSVKTLAMFRCWGKGPAYVDIGRIFYFQDDLDEWLNRHADQTVTR